ncbi:hypothetical protein KY285_023771 [Solanum tuberosum]|nr:hypothetical protein KY289_024101 [Solanum tuberosum]KAH0675970.1 hypothetical protein KY285_023771 [Solanum tuberosum]
MKEMNHMIQKIFEILMRVKSNLSELGCPTMMHSGWGKDGGNLHIELNEHGQVIGSEGTRLSSKLGVLARNGILAPLNHKDWRLVPSMYKDRIWVHIKHEAKIIGYDPYNTDIEHLAHCPDRVEEFQWRSLVHYWSSKEAKMTKMNNGVKQTRIEVFKKTYIRVNKQLVNEIAGEVMVYPELNVPGSALNDVYSQIMGSDTQGIVRTLGKGASPSLVYGPIYKRSQAEKRDFDSRV